MNVSMDGLRRNMVRSYNAVCNKLNDGEISDCGELPLSNYETEGSRVEKFELAMVSIVEDPEEGCEFRFEQEDVDFFRKKMFDALERGDFDRAMKVVE